MSEAGVGWNWAYQLALLGHEVWVITTPTGRAAIEAFFERQPLRNLHFQYVPFPRYLRWLLVSRLFWPLEYKLWQRHITAYARAIDRDQNFDVVHHVSYGSLLGGSNLWRLGKPFVFGPVGGGQLAPEAFKSYFRDDWRNERVRSFIIRHLPRLVIRGRTIRAANVVLVTNVDTARAARRLGARQVELFFDSGVPPEFVGRADARPTATGRRLGLLWVGRLVPLKALRLALEALAMVDRATPLHSTIVGSGPQECFIADWLAELGIADRVTWIGQVRRDEMWRLYAENDLFLFTSLRDSLGAVLIEAMACALPIITLDHHGARDLVPAAAGIKIDVSTPVETAAKIARAIERLCRDGEARVMLGQAGAAAALEHRWDRKAARASELYRRLVSECSERAPASARAWRCGGSITPSEETPCTTPGPHATQRCIMVPSS